MVQLVFFISLLLIAGVSAHNLTFMFVTSFGQFGFNASGVVPAADIALEDINNHPSVLWGYNLVYDQVRDSECHRGRSLDAFFGGIFDGPPNKLAVIGCGCSVATEPVAEISHQWNISHISYASSSAALSNRSKYKSFFRNTFNMQIIAPAMLSAVSFFNWTRIAILTQEEGLFTGTESDIMSEFKVAGIEVASRTFQTVDQKPTDAIRDLFQSDEDYRVFFLNCFSEHARRIICYASKNNFAFPRYVWIHYDWYPKNWWRSDGSVPGDCSDEELMEFLDKALTIQLPEFGNETTEIGTSLTNFTRTYEETARSRNFGITNQAYKLYDVIWVLALALNGTIAMVKDGDINGTGCEAVPGSLVPLEEFNYTNSMMGCLIQWNIQQTDFSGVTGRVSFDESGTRVHNDVFFLQYTMKEGKLKISRFAEVNKLKDFAFTLLPGISVSDIYPDGPPLDGRPNNIVLTFETWLVVIFYTLATLGIVFAIACFLFNLLFRNRKTVRLSSPTLNYFIIAGTILMYASVFFYFLPSTVVVVVKVRCVYWLFTIGYSLAFGAVFVKMWRVYQIFHNPHPNKKILKDWKLIAIVLVISVIVTGLLLIGEVVPGLRGVVVHLVDLEHPQGRNSFGIREDYSVLVCQRTSSPSYFWQIFVFAYLVILQVIGLVLAIQTRKVKLRGLRDSKYVAAIIYISSISIVVMALVTFALDKYINIGTGILAVVILALTTIFLILIFVPKMILLYRDPHGKNSSVVNHNSRVSATATAIDAEIGQKVVMLEKTVLEREKTIAELKVQINSLTKKDNDIEQNGNLASKSDIDQNGSCT